jgi:hypothetical protein
MTRHGFEMSLLVQHDALSCKLRLFQLRGDLWQSNMSSDERDHARASNLRALQHFYQAVDVRAGDVNFNELVPSPKKCLVARPRGLLENIVHNRVPYPAWARNDNRTQRRVGIRDVTEEARVKGGVEPLQSFLVRARGRLLARDGNIEPTTDDGHVLREQAERGCTCIAQMSGALSALMESGHLRRKQQRLLPRRGLARTILRRARARCCPTLVFRSARRGELRDPAYGVSP